MPTLPSLPSRRALLRGGAATVGLAAAGAAAGCASTVSISSDPKQQVLWYWSNSFNPALLDQAARQIPGASSRLRADLIGGSFDTKLRTSLAGHAYIPDLTCINSNCALYFPNEDLFTDLRTLGSEKVKDEYYDWKWQLGVAPSGRQIFFPMDTGPTGIYYRRDVMAKAGLPSDPAEVSAAISTWDDYIAVGRRLRTKVGAALVPTAGAIFDRYIDAAPQRYFGKDDTPIFQESGSSIRQGWEIAVKAIRDRVTGNLQNSNDQNAAFVKGTVASNITAVWWLPTLRDTAPGTKGMWGLAAQPERAGNFGGSFIGVSSTAKDPKAAWDFISWAMSAKNQVASYNDLGLFPSTPASFEGGQIRGDTKFFGGQDTLAFFAAQAETVPTTFVSAYENQTGAFDIELANVEAGGKDPERAWRDAVDQTDRVLSKRGIV